MMIQENDHAVSPIDDSEDGARSALVLRLLGLGRGLSHADLGNVVILGPDTTTPRQLTEGLGFNAQSSLGETLPNVTSVVSSGQDDIRLKDGVSSVGKGRSTRLKLHTLDQKVGEQRVSVTGNQRKRSTLGIVLLRPVVVVVLGRDQGREERLAESVLLDQTFDNDEQHLSPDFTDSVHSPVTGLVERLESRRVRRHVGRVDKVSDTTLSVGSPRTHAVLLLVFAVFGDLTDQGREGITPTLSHSAGLAVSETSAVGRSSSQTSGETVTVLVDDDTGFEVAVSEGSSSVPNVHPHSRLTSIRRGHEVGIIGTRPVLGLTDNSVSAKSASSKVVHLEISADLVESEAVEQVVVHVASVE